MKSTPLTIVKLLQKSKYWLLGLALGLISLHLFLIWKVSFHLDAGSAATRNVGSELLSLSLLFWGAALSIAWQKRHTLRLESGVFSSFLGATIIILVVLKSLSLSNNDSFLHISPLLSGVGLCLLASGVKGLKQYWKELLLLLVLAIPVEETLARLIDLDTLTAQFADFILVHLGFDAARNGTTVALPTGAVKVDPGCSGLRAITRLVQLSTLILVMIPTSWIGKVIIPFMAVLVAFTVNSVRVVVLALLIANSHRKAFDFWHEGTGSHGISILSVLILWLLCQFLIQRDEAGNEGVGSSAKSERRFPPSGTL
ncbi:MAG: cyanoexosortase A [Chroococcidiopsidaceae cyanobacterium CP_BM_ER_R8_30]|nr:cyanoexosortase A [Chroococcidiopsidaceae cyanobacterium CP_BM_ER_R8_30]